MCERQENDALADLRVTQADSAGKSRSCIDNQTSRPFFSEIVFIQRKQRRKVCQGETSNSKGAFHAAKLFLARRIDTRFLRLFFAGSLEPNVLPIKFKAARIGDSRGFK